MMLHACTACGHTVFPAPKLCARCGGDIWMDLPCDRGVVTAVTTIRTTLLAEVRTAHDVRVIARLQHAATPGTSVALTEHEDGAVWGSI